MVGDAKGYASSFPLMGNSFPQGVTKMHIRRTEIGLPGWHAVCTLVWYKGNGKIVKQKGDSRDSQDW